MINLTIPEDKAWQQESETVRTHDDYGIRTGLYRQSKDDSRYQEKDSREGAILYNGNQNIGKEKGIPLWMP